MKKITQHQSQLLFLFVVVIAVIAVAVEEVSSSLIQEKNNDIRPFPIIGFDVTKKEKEANIHNVNKENKNNYKEEKSFRLRQQQQQQQQSNINDDQQLTRGSLLPEGIDINQVMEEQHRQPPESLIKMARNSKTVKTATTVETTNVKTTSSSSYSTDLLTSFPSSDFTWYGGGYSLGYAFGDFNGLGQSSFAIYGDANTGGRGLESTFTIYGDSYIQVSYYAQIQCSDPGISIFPSSGSSYWAWAATYGRIQFAIDCGQPCLYGQTSSNCATSVSLALGAWYTLVLYHLPSSFSTQGYVYAGRDTDITSASPIASTTISEYYSPTDYLRFSINADTDSSTSYTNFAKLYVEYNHVGDDDDHSGGSGSSSVITSYSALLLYSIPTGMTWYGGGSLSYSFGQMYYSSGLYSLAIYGDAGSDGTGRGLESDFYVQGDFTMRVSFFMYDACTDPGISIFPSHTAWYEGPYYSRIQASMNCGTVYLYGKTTSAYGYNWLYAGNWYTFELKHLPSSSKTQLNYYYGKDIDFSSSSSMAGSYLGSITIYEYYLSSQLLHVGLIADTDSWSVYCQFTNLVITTASSPGSSPVAYPTIVPTRTPSRPPTRLPTISPTQTSYYAPLNSGFPYDMVWYGGGGLNYYFGNYYTSVVSLQIYGDASEGSRGVETTYQASGDIKVRVSFYLYDSCVDPGVSIFPATGSSYWLWSARVGRIQASLDCSVPVLYGEYSSATAYSGLALGYWYTIVLTHNPSYGRTTASYYRGYDIDPSSVGASYALQSEITIYESFSMSTPLRMGLSADTDSYSRYCQLAEFRVTPFVSDSTGGYTPTLFPTRTPTLSPTRAVVYEASLLSSIPYDMAWYGGYSLSYSFSDFYGTGVSSFGIAGDAYEGSRGLETTYRQSGEFSVRVSFYLYSSCMDPGLTLFSSQSYWYWGKAPGRIQLSVDCGQPVFYGMTRSMVSLNYLSTGYWYTLVISHSAKSSATKAFIYQGYDVNPDEMTTYSVSPTAFDVMEIPDGKRPSRMHNATENTSSLNSVSSNSNHLVSTQSKHITPMATGTLIASMTIAESFSTGQSVGVALAADTDNSYQYCQFAYLKVVQGTTKGSGAGSGDDDDYVTIALPSTSSSLSLTVILIIVGVVGGVCCIGVAFWIFFACCRRNGGSKASNVYPDFTPSAPPPPSGGGYGMPTPTPAPTVIPASMPVPVPVQAQVQIPMQTATPAMVPLVKPTYTQPNNGGVSQYQPYPNNTIYPYNGGDMGGAGGVMLGSSNPYQVPVATVVPAVPLTNYSNSYAPGPSGYDSGYGGTTGATYGGYNVEMVPMDTSPRGGDEVL